jgi:hypothetical protein
VTDLLAQCGTRSRGRGSRPDARILHGDARWRHRFLHGRGFVRGESPLPLATVPRATTRLDGPDKRRALHRRGGRRSGRRPKTDRTSCGWRVSRCGLLHQHSGKRIPVHSLLYEDAVEDQVMMDFFAVVLARRGGTGRVQPCGEDRGVTAPADRYRNGARSPAGPLSRCGPLLVGLQIGVLGTVFGLAMGLFFTRWFVGLMEELSPLPYWSGTLLHWPSFLVPQGSSASYLPLVGVRVSGLARRADSAARCYTRAPDRAQ